MFFNALRRFAVFPVDKADMVCCIEICKSASGGVVSVLLPRHDNAGALIFSFAAAAPPLLAFSRPLWYNAAESEVLPMNEIDKKLDVLARVAGALNAEGVTWAVGGSLLLFIKGLVPSFNDIDLMVAEADAGRARDVLLRLGTLMPPLPTDKYKTRVFLEFDIDGVDLDLIAGFTIVNKGLDYYFPLLKRNIEEYALMGELRIPLQSLEDWRLYYRLMDRPDRAELIDRAIGGKKEERHD